MDKDEPKQNGSGRGTRGNRGRSGCEDTEKEGRGWNPNKEEEEEDDDDDDEDDEEE